MFCGLEEEQTRFRKKKAKKRNKRKAANRGQKWVAWDEWVS